MVVHVLNPAHTATARDFFMDFEGIFNAGLCKHLTQPARYKKNAYEKL